jgi:HTH-type transcriptional regulator, competence development regulator
MQLNKDRSWLLKKAEQEDNDIVSVGGFVNRVAATEQNGSEESVEIPESARRHAFARFVELSRRRQRLTVEQLSEKADVDVAELIAIEEADTVSPEPRTIYQLATVLNVPQQKLMELSGLSRTRDRRFQDATVRFAARSEPVADLSADEEELFQEYVKVLVDTSNGD